MVQQNQPAEQYFICINISSSPQTNTESMLHVRTCSHANSLECPKNHQFS